MKDRKPFTTSLNTNLLKEIKKLAIDLDRTVNDLLEEGIQYLLQKYKQKAHTGYNQPISEKQTELNTMGQPKRVVKRDKIIQK